MAWLVGFVEGDGWFSITKNGIYCKYEFGIEVSEKDIKLLYKLKEMLGVGRVSRRRTREGMVIFKLTSKAHLRNIALPILILILCLLPSIGIILFKKQSS